MNIDIIPIKIEESNKKIAINNISWYFTVNKLIKKIEIEINTIVNELILKENSNIVYESGKFKLLFSDFEFEYRSDDGIHYRIKEENDKFNLFINGLNFSKLLKKRKKLIKENRNINTNTYIEPLEQLEIDVNTNPFDLTNDTTYNKNTVTPFD